MFITKLELFPLLMNKTKKSRIKNGAVQYLKKHRFSFLLKKENQVQFKNNAILGYI